MKCERDDLDLTVFHGVTALLGPNRAHALLLLLGNLVADLQGADGEYLAGPDGLSAIHRLKSEAGLMGFMRLARACEAIDDELPSRVPAEAFQHLRMALTAALPLIARLDRTMGERPEHSFAS